MKTIKNVVDGLLADPSFSRFANTKSKTPIGSSYKLEFINYNDLIIPEEQREEMVRSIKRMLFETVDLKKFIAGTAVRVEGRLFLADGFQRTTALAVSLTLNPFCNTAKELRALGGIDEENMLREQKTPPVIVPVMVYDAVKPSDIGEVFIAVNGARTQVDPFFLHNTYSILWSQGVVSRETKMASNIDRILSNGIISRRLVKDSSDNNVDTVYGTLRIQDSYKTDGTGDDMLVALEVLDSVFGAVPMKGDFVKQFAILIHHLDDLCTKAGVSHYTRSDLVRFLQGYVTPGKDVEQVFKDLLVKARSMYGHSATKTWESAWLTGVYLDSDPHGQSIAAQHNVYLPF